MSEHHEGAVDHNIAKLFPQKREKKNLKPKSFMNIALSWKTSWIVDNFYEKPDDVRKFAFEQDFVEGGIGRGFIGRRTEKQFLFPGFKERFEGIIGENY